MAATPKVTESTTDSAVSKGIAHVNEPLTARRLFWDAKRDGKTREAIGQDILAALDEQATRAQALRQTVEAWMTQPEPENRTGKRIAAMAHLLMSMNADLTEAEAIAKVREAEKATKGEATA